MKTFKESWDLHKALAAAGLPATEAVDSPVPENREPMSIKAGQVLLMSGMNGFWHVLVLKEWTPGFSWVVIPFSILDVPGRDEYKSDYDHGPLCRGVLQIWNGRTMSEEFLKTCYLVDNVDQDMVDQAWEAWRRYFLGEDPEVQVGSSADETTQDYRNTILRCWAEVDAKDLAIQLPDDDDEE